MVRQPAKIVLDLKHSSNSQFRQFDASHITIQNYKMYRFLQKSPVANDMIRECHDV